MIPSLNSSLPLLRSHTSPHTFSIIAVSALATSSSRSTA